MVLIIAPLAKNSMTYYLFEIINGGAGKYILVDTLGIFFASWAIWLLAGWLIIIWWKGAGQFKYGRLFEAALVIAVVYAINSIIGYLYFESRPFTEQGVNLLISVPMLSKSFPSDHAALAFVLAMSIFKLNKKLWWSFIIAALIALARVFVGVHYPHDVLVGIMIGIIVSWIVFYLFKYYTLKLSSKLK